MNRLRRDRRLVTFSNSLAISGWLSPRYVAILRFASSRATYRAAISRSSMSPAIRCLHGLHVLLNILQFALHQREIRRTNSTRFHSRNDVDKRDARGSARSDATTTRFSEGRDQSMPAECGRRVRARQQTNKTGNRNCLQHCLRIAYRQTRRNRNYRTTSKWWGRQDSNLRSHEAADLQSAPFATRDTPPLDDSAIRPLDEPATDLPWA